MPPAGFEPTIPASERPQTHALDRAADGIGSPTLYMIKIYHGHAFLHPSRGLNCTFLDMYSDNLMFAHVPVVWAEAKRTCILC